MHPSGLNTDLWRLSVENQTQWPIPDKEYSCGFPKNIRLLNMSPFAGCKKFYLSGTRGVRISSLEDDDSPSIYFML